MANEWFRMYHVFATDPKVQMMSEAHQRRFVMLLCLKCSNGDVTLHDDEIAFQLRISNDEWEQTKQAFISKNLITKDNHPVAWDKRQFVSDSSAERVAKHRAKKKQECNVAVTPPDTDTDTDTELNTIDTNVSIVVNGETIPDCPHQEIISLYKKNIPMGIQPKAWDGARAVALKSRWRERKERQNLAWWDKFFDYVSQSKFLTGQVVAKDRKPFEITLPWLLKPENFNKIIEGYYHR